MKKIVMAACLWLCGAATALAWTGTVQNVHDGDTVNIAPGGDEENLVAVRLYGLDAPELDQAGGVESGQYLHALLPQGAEVEIIPYGVDAYGRALGLIVRNARTVNATMLAAGQAWLYERYCKASFCRKWKKLQQEARDEKKGLWNGEAVPPWEWRRKN